MAGYQDGFKRILDEETSHCAAWSLAMLAAIQAKELVLIEGPPDSLS